MAPGSTTKSGAAGPPCWFVSGATGDAGHWTTVADILADTYTVLTYDRRANSRSPQPPGWASTTIGEQADDAAALLRGLGLVPAIVAGTSAAAGILADLCLRHRACCRAPSSTNRHSRPRYPTSAPSTLRARRGSRKEGPGAARAPRWRCRGSRGTARR